MPNDRREQRQPPPGRAAGTARRLRHVAWVAALLAGMAAGAAPATGQAQEPCVDVNNTTDYWWPVRLRIGKGPPQQLRIDANTFGRLCMRGIGPTEEPIAVSVRSSWVPVGECDLPAGGLVTVERRAGPDGEEVTHVGCSPPGG